MFRLEEKKLESKNETIRENGMLVLLAVSPIVIGFFYYVMIQLPIIGTIWMYAAPFTVLYYWGWVATIFRSRFKSLLKTMLCMNALGIVTYVLYIWQYAFIEEGAQIPVLALLSQLYTVSLGFITTWIGVLIDGSGSLNVEMMSVTASVITETAAILFMIAASVIGYFVGKSQEKKKQEKETAEPEETQEIEAIFSDRQLEEYELQREQETQEQQQ